MQMFRQRETAPLLPLHTAETAVEGAVQKRKEASLEAKPMSSDETFLVSMFGGLVLFVFLVTVVLSVVAPYLGITDAHQGQWDQEKEAYLRMAFLEM